MRIKTCLSVYKRLWHAISAQYRLAKVQTTWREKNRHNHTIPDNYPFPSNQVFVGNHTYGPLKVIQYRDDVHLRIGSYCSIAEGVVFLLGGEHPTDKLSTFLFQRIMFHKIGVEDHAKGDIIIDDDVWIGYGSIILSGVHLAKGTIVAAGSVVCKSTEPFDVVGGCPAKFIKKRLPQEVIGRLNNIDFGKINANMIVENERIFNLPVCEFGNEDWTFVETYLMRDRLSRIK